MSASELPGGNSLENTIQIGPTGKKLLLLGRSAGRSGRGIPSLFPTALSWTGFTCAVVWLCG